ncbi:MAG: hypothetical protein BWZ04_02921 [Firmicutes bacterium ADurb.BinA205]|nr:MAG: hypothetical protein BWZ04_02921 [Firmicutes bacterium ADurb.BinA205]
MSACIDASPFKYLSAYRSRKAERSSQLIGEMSAVTHIVEALVSDSACVVGMAGTCKLVKIIGLRLILGDILNERTERSAGGAVIENAGHHMGHYILVRRCRISADFGIASRHELCKLVSVDILA